MTTVSLDNLYRHNIYNEMFGITFWSSLFNSPIMIELDNKIISKSTGDVIGYVTEGMIDSLYTEYENSRVRFMGGDTYSILHPVQLQEMMRSLKN
jgi:hypothetical protein